MRRNRYVVRYGADVWHDCCAMNENRPVGVRVQQFQGSAGIFTYLSFHTAFPVPAHASLLLNCSVAQIGGHLSLELDQSLFTVCPSSRPVNSSLPCSSFQRLCLCVQSYSTKPQDQTTLQRLSTFDVMVETYASKPTKSHYAKVNVVQDLSY